MENSEQSFAGQRVLQRIEEEPRSSEAALIELRQEPKVSEAVAAELASSYGEKTEDLYRFLGSVIDDRRLYLDIELSDNAVEAAANDEEMTRILGNLSLKYSGAFGVNREQQSLHDEVVSRSRRANELLAAARLSIVAVNAQEYKKRRA